MVPEIDKPAGETPDPWETVTWAGLERAQFRDVLSATPAQRLAWLEEAMRLAHASGALPLQTGSRIAPSPCEDD